MALEQSHWREANRLAQKALQSLSLSTKPNLWTSGEGLYRFLLARAQQHLGYIQEAINNLEKARQETHPQYEPQLYIDILIKLRQLYFDQGEYIKAFEFKQEQRLIEYKYGFQAFVGASLLSPEQHIIKLVLTPTGQQAIVTQEIAASGREQDVKHLIERISRNDYKLIIIHGQSGVGKSSILKAGLVPALKQQAIGERDVLPIVMGVYTNWVKDLGRNLVEAFKEIRRVNLPEPLYVLEAIFEELQKNESQNLLTVLIFDQFEEFFFTCTKPTERQIFFKFLRDCLNISFVQVILSLREDYLHYLLESERFINLDAINNNILDKNIRYSLSNFSREEARSVIRSLTNRVHFYLQPKLIDKLVHDLAGEVGEVRPIELQVVGSQLQSDNITTLAQYQQYGSKEKLIEKWLQKVIKDCGAENERAAQLVLYFLTDEKDIRPHKTRTELLTDLWRVNLASDAKKLDLVLQILVGSGLVLKIPQAPTVCYQLVHDYLVSFIRQSQQAREIAAAEENLKRSEQRRKKYLKLLAVSMTTGFVLIVIAVSAFFESIQAKIYAISILSLSSEVLLASNNGLDALIEAIKAKQKLQKLVWTDASTCASYSQRWR